MVHRSRLTALALMAGVAWSCGHVARAPEPTPAPLAHYSDAALSFDYPRSWKVSHYFFLSTMSSSIVYLTTQPTHDPCVRTISPNRPDARTTETITCGEPVTRLAPGGILAESESFGNPGWSVDRAKGSPLQVDGKPARWNVEQPG